jgi:hypothetical protein
MPNLQYPIYVHCHKVPTVTQIVCIPDIVRPTTRPDPDALLALRLGKCADTFIERTIAKVAQRVEMSGQSDGRIGVWSFENTSDHNEGKGGLGGVQRRRGHGKRKSYLYYRMHGSVHIC